VNARSESWYTTSDLRADGHGAKLDFEGGYEARPFSSDRIRTGAKLSWADAEYMQTFFGVNAVQSTSSGLPVYGAGSGIKDYGLNVNWRHAFSKRWFSNAGLQARRLSASANASPLVTSPMETSASVLVGYRF
jgi:outer membrane scaffolding protein for murein synthesis (MipA/OmpV family)